MTIDTDLDPDNMTDEQRVRFRELRAESGIDAMFAVSGARNAVADAAKVLADAQASLHVAQAAFDTKRADIEHRAQLALAQANIPLGRATDNYNVARASHENALLALEQAQTAVEDHAAG